MTPKRICIIFALIDLLGVAYFTAAYWLLLTKGI